MFNYIITNLSTVIVAAILVAAVAVAITIIIRDKKKYGNLCGRSCQGCPMAGNCQKEKEMENRKQAV